MSIDELGRAAATDARRRAVQRVDTDAMLSRLYRLRRRRTVGSALGAVVVVGALVAGGVLISHSRQAESGHAPAARGTTTPAGFCADRNVRCLGGNRMRFEDLPSPITVTLPPNFKRSFSVGPTRIEAYRSDVSTTGVTVTEDAVPAKYGPASWVRDPAAGTTATSVARWLAQRPFLTHTRLTRTTVDGLMAWHVAGVLKRGAALPAPKVGGNVAPTFGASFDISEGYRANLTGDYTILDVPGAGVTVIWSWTLNHRPRALDPNQAFIDGLSFG